MEGHASPIGPYIRNLKLSQDRSFNVSRYIVEQIVPENYGKQRMPPVESAIRTEDDKTIEKWTREKMTASGFSFMKPKCKDLRCKESTIQPLNGSRYVSTLIMQALLLCLITEFCRVINCGN